MSLDQTNYATIRGGLRSLFEQARDTDALSFAASLLRLSAFGRVTWDPFDETQPLLEQCRNLVYAPLQGSFQVRVLLLVYSHLLDLTDLHQVLANMLRIARGLPYNPDPSNFGEATAPCWLGPYTSTSARPSS